MLENNTQEPSSSVVLATNKRYFIEDKYLIFDCFYNQNKMFTPMLKDWIGLYPCENIKLYKPLIFEYVMDHSRMATASCYKIKFISQLFSKFIHCSGKYQFVYVDSYFKIIAMSDPIEFLHKNDCNCNVALAQKNCMAHLKMGLDIDVVIQRLKCIEARLQNHEESKKEAMELNEQLVTKLEACEMLRSRGEQFIDDLYKALDQGKQVKLTNSKGHSRWIKRLRTPEIKNYMMSTKTLKNDVYLTAIINTQEQEIQRLKVINNEFRNKLLKHKEHLTYISESEISESDDANAVFPKTFSTEPVSSTVVNKNYSADSEISDDYCE